MNDTEIENLWSMLEPDGHRRARIESRLFEWLEASETSLVREWLGLLRIEPWAGLGYAGVGAASLVALTPVGWVVSFVLN